MQELLNASAKANYIYMEMRRKHVAKLDDPPTDAQIRAITRLCMVLHIAEPLECSPRTKREARNLLYDLYCKLKGVKT